ncbi:MAG: helicase, partial [Pseudomonadota bacterium]
LWSLYHGKSLPAPVPKDGVVSYNVEGDVDETFYQTIGYPVYGGRAIRIDMLDRVVNAVYEGADKGKFKAEHKMAEWLGSSIEDLYKVLEALGHKKIYDPAEEAVKAEAEASVETPEEELKAEVATEAEKSQNQEKPELATFALKKGKANQKAEAVKPKSGGKPHKDKKKDKKKGKRNKSTNKQPKVMSAQAKVEDDNPFAVLEALKKGNG